MDKRSHGLSVRRNFIRADPYRLVQRLIVEPCPLNWRFYAKMHIWRCLGLVRNELGVELDQLLDVSTGPKQQNF